MEDIRIDIGVSTQFEVNLSDHHFLGIKEIVLTIKNPPFARTEPVVERVFIKPGIHTVTITPEESMNITAQAEYDFTKVLDDEKGTRLKMTDNGKIVTRRGVGGGIT